jgi:hypothetical protein
MSFFISNNLPVKLLGGKRLTAFLLHRGAAYFAATGVLYPSFRSKASGIFPLNKARRSQTVPA